MTARQRIGLILVDVAAAVVQHSVIVAIMFGALLLLALLAGCCTVAYRHDGQRYYRQDSCPWGERVVCDSATRLPDPATWTEGCR